MPSFAESESLEKSGNGQTLPILITMGEPAGIGPEVALAAFTHFGGRIGSHPLKLVGDADIFAAQKQAVIPTTARARCEPGKPDGANAACVIEASHTCMTIRGAKKPGAVMVTSALRGAFKKNPSTRAEVLALMLNAERSSL